MKKALKRKSTSGCYYFVDGKMMPGIHGRLWGDVSGLWGNVSGLRGDVSGLLGNE